MEREAGRVGSNGVNAAVSPARVPNTPVLACEAVRYEWTSSVQSAWVVLGFEHTACEVGVASENAELLFGAPPAELIGRPLADLIGAAAVERIRAELSWSRDSESDCRFPIEITVPADCDHRVKGIAHRHGRWSYLELPTACPRGLADDDLRARFLQMLRALNAWSRASAELPARLCEMLAELLGYERTYYCVFDVNGHGCVEAEHLSAPLPSLRGHWFPASDVPQVARRLYLRNRFRLLVDATCGGSPLMSAEGPSPPLDLSYAISRLPGATHLRFVCNLGMRATVSFSVVRNGELAALIGGHSRDARFVSFETLSLCQQLVEAFAGRVEALELLEQQRAMESKRLRIPYLAQWLPSRGARAQALQGAPLESLTSLLDADGFIYRADGQILAGRLPEDPRAPFDAVRFLDEVQSRCRLDGVWMTHDARQAFGAGAPPTVGGVAGLRVHDNLLLWWRGERAIKERWAGDPSRAVQLCPDGRVGPRSSFATWEREVRGQCEPWQPFHRRVLEELCLHVVQSMSRIYAARVAAHAERLDAVVQGVADGIIVVETSGEIMAYNRAAERIFGYAAEEVLGKDGSLLIVYAPDCSHREFDLAKLKRDGGSTLQMRGRRKGGAEFPIEVSLSFIEDSASSGREVVGVVRDITERLEVERALREAKEAAERANDNKTRFLANMSHELRTPLHTILGFADSMLDRGDAVPPARRQRYLDVIKGSAERLLGLINDLLDLSKLEAGMMRFDFASVPFATTLGRLLEHSRLEVMGLTRQRGVQIDIEVRGDDTLVQVDTQRLTQVLINLLGNAAKFSPEGGDEPSRVTVVARLHARQDEWSVEVRDRGVGIPHDELERIFDKFVQSSRTRTDAGGTGLGLAVCREIMSAHGGRIWAENAEGGGARFTLRSPIDGCPPASARPGVGARVEGPANGIE